MPFSNDQLETWSKQGSITQSAATYATIKGMLESTEAPYYWKSYDTFLQGSYGNDTNIFADSDVDVVIKLTSAFQHNISELEESQQQAFHAALSNAEYGFSQFKSDVLAWLVKKYGSDVEAGSKAITIKSNGSRRESDVLPAITYRKYTRFRSSNDQSYVEGVCFWSSNGTKIINYPKVHSENVTAKHQATRGWFKPTVRTFKNMRNRMTDLGYIKFGLAPSYFLEGLLYNVPEHRFGGTYTQNFTDVLTWLKQADRSKFVCANEQYYLCHPNHPVCWRYEDSQSFLSALVDFWNAG